MVTVCHFHWLSLLSYCHRQCFFSATVLVIVRAVVTLLPLLLLVWLLLHFHRLCHSASMSLWLSFCLPMWLSESLIPLYCFFDCLCHCHSLCQGLWARKSHTEVTVTQRPWQRLWQWHRQSKKQYKGISDTDSHYHFYFYVTINVTTSLTVIIIVTIAILWKSLSLSLLQ